MDIKKLPRYRDILDVEENHITIATFGDLDNKGLEQFVSKLTNSFNWAIVHYSGFKAIILIYKPSVSFRKD